MLKLIKQALCAPWKTSVALLSVQIVLQQSNAAPLFEFNSSFHPENMNDFVERGSLLSMQIPNVDDFFNPSWQHNEMSAPTFLSSAEGFGRALSDNFYSQNGTLNEEYTYFLVNPIEFNLQLTPNHAYFADGSTVITWASNGNEVGDVNGDIFEIYAKIINRHGVSKVSTFRVNETRIGGGKLIMPRVVVLPGERFMVVWSEAIRNGYLTAAAFRIFDANAHLLTGEIDLGIPEFFSFPSQYEQVVSGISVQNDDSVIISWERRYACGNLYDFEEKYNAFFTVVDANTGTVRQHYAASTSQLPDLAFCAYQSPVDNNDIRFPSITALSGGKFALAVYENVDGKSVDSSDIYLTIYNADYTMMAHFPIDSHPDYLAWKQYTSDLAASEEKLAAVWDGHSNHEFYGLWLKLFNHEGLALTDPIAVSDETAYIKANPRVSFSPDGQTLAVFWEMLGGLLGDENETHSVLKLFNHYGEALTENIIVNDFVTGENVPFTPGFFNLISSSNIEVNPVTKDWLTLFLSQSANIENPDGLNLVARSYDSIGQPTLFRRIAENIEQAIEYQEDRAIILAPIRVNSDKDITVNLVLSQSDIGELVLGAGGEQTIDRETACWCVVGTAPEVNAALDAVRVVLPENYHENLEIEITVSAESLTQHGLVKLTGQLINDLPRLKASVEADWHLLEGEPLSIHLDDLFEDPDLVNGEPERLRYELAREVVPDFVRLDETTGVLTVSPSENSAEGIYTVYIAAIDESGGRLEEPFIFRVGSTKLLLPDTQRKYTEGNSAVNQLGLSIQSPARDVDVGLVLVPESTGTWHFDEDFAAGANVTITENEGELGLFGSVSAVNGVLRRVSVSLNQADPFFQLGIEVDDGLLKVAGTIDFLPTASQPPRLSGQSAPFVYLEGSGPQLLDENLTLTDENDVELIEVRVSLAPYFPEDTLSVTGISPITAEWDRSSGQLILSGRGKLATYEDLLRQVKYDNQALAPAVIEKTITYTAYDVNGLAGELERVLHITALNDAPVLSGGGHLEAILQGSQEHAGQTIESMLSGSVNDAETTLNEIGIALTAVDNAQGQWQRQFDGESEWVDISHETLSESQALLLAAQDKIRFVPGDRLWHGESAISYVAWDRTEGAHGQRVDVTTRGSRTAFSASVQSAILRVQNVADGPLISNFIERIEYQENQEFLSLFPELSIWSDSATVSRLKLILEGATDKDSFTFSTSAKEKIAEAGLSWQILYNGVEVIGEASIEDYELISRGIEYQNPSDNPDEAPRTVTLTVYDANLSKEIMSQLNIKAVNDAPLLNASGYLPGTPMNGYGTPITIREFLGISAEDLDNDVAGIAVTGLETQHGAWEILEANQDEWHTFQASLKSARLLGLDTSIRFKPESGFHGQVGLTYAVWDGSQGHAGGTIDASVRGGKNALSDKLATSIATVVLENKPPEIALPGLRKIEYPGGGRTEKLFPELSLTDESNALFRAEIRIEPFIPEEDALGHGHLIGGLKWQGVNGTYTLEGRSSLQNYQTILREVFYYNTAETPDVTPRKIYLTTRDDISDSNSVSISLTFLASRPVLLGRGQFSALVQGSDSRETGDTIKNILSSHTGNTTLPVGIALSKVNDEHGEWFYRLEEGKVDEAGESEWERVLPLDNRLLLLKGADRLRFEPKGDFEGKLEDVISYYAWTGRDLDSGEKVSNTTIQGNNAFSLEPSHSNLEVINKEKETIPPPALESRVSIYTSSETGGISAFEEIILPPQIFPLEESFKIALPVDDLNQNLEPLMFTATLKNGSALPENFKLFTVPEQVGIYEPYPADIIPFFFRGTLNYDPGCQNKALFKFIDETVFFNAHPFLGPQLLNMSEPNSPRLLDYLFQHHDLNFLCIDKLLTHQDQVYSSVIGLKGENQIIAFQVLDDHITPLGNITLSDPILDISVSLPYLYALTTSKSWKKADQLPRKNLLSLILLIQLI